MSPRSSSSYRMAIFSSQFAVTERFGDHYEGVAPIGQPFGYTQLLANDKKGQRTVVIKSLTIEDSTPDGDIGCFEREIHLMESLKHPTIPRCIDSFKFDNAEGKGMVLIQSHIGVGSGTGQTLAQQVEAGKTFSEREIKVIAKQLLKGLSYLHSKGLVHRDIKPSNIAISNSGAGRRQVTQASWLNLGTVQYIQAQRPDALVGTYGYMAPEQVGGQAAFASDLYSLGATLVYLATGCHLGELPRNGLKVRFACSTERLSANFQRWINWLIEPVSGDRPQSAQQALTALNRLPVAMLAQRLNTGRRSTESTLPVPIANSGRNHYQPFFTRIRLNRRSQSLALVIPPAGLRSTNAKKSFTPLLIGGVMLASALYLLSLLHFSSTMLTTPRGMATLAAIALGAASVVYSFRFLQNGWRFLHRALFRSIHVQIDNDLLLISYKHWFKSPEYILNTHRDSIYNISALPDGGALRVLTHHNRTQSSCVCYKLSVDDGALSHRDIRWLTSLLNDWRAYL